MSEQVSELFGQLCELADDCGVVPEDSSGVDGVWTTRVPARGRDDDWKVAMNADLDTEHSVTGFPTEGRSATISPGQATVWHGGMPVAVISPNGGELFGRPGDLEDELIDDVVAWRDVLDQPEGERLEWAVEAAVDAHDQGDSPVVAAEWAAEQHLLDHRREDVLRRVREEVDG